jgi:hypothetical protein
MRSKLLIILISLVSFLVWTPAPMLGAVQQHSVHHRRVHHITGTISGIARSCSMRRLSVGRH